MAAVIRNLCAWGVGAALGVAVRLFPHWMAPKQAVFLRAVRQALEKEDAQAVADDNPQGQRYKGDR